MEKSVLEKLCRDTRIGINTKETVKVQNRFDCFCAWGDLLSDIKPSENTARPFKTLNDLRDDDLREFENTKAIADAFPKSEDSLISAPQSFEGGAK